MDTQELVYCYSYVAEWSEDDRLFVARVAEWPSLTAHGSSSKAALQELQELIRFAIEDCEECGDVYPLPQGEKG